MDLGPGRRSHGIAAVAGLIAAVLAALFLAAAASAEVRSGSATDPLNGLPPGQDIVAASASYDTVAGTITAAVTTAGPPENTATRALAVYFGVLQGTECVSPMALVLGIYSQPTTAVWGSDSEEGPAAKSVSGSTTVMTASGPSLATQPYDCAQTIVGEVIGETEFEGFEGLASPILLSAPPPPLPPPPPSSPPASTPPPSTPVPPPAPKLAKLSLAPSRSLTLRRGKWKKVKLRITNRGTATAAKVSLKLGKAKGVAVKPKSGQLKLKTIAPGKSKTASFKLLLTKRAKATSTIKLRVTGAKGVKSTGALTVKAWKKSRGHPGKGKGKEPKAPEKSPLAEKLFFGYEMQASESATLIGYAFLDETWAYHGIPAGGLPNCTEVTGSADKEGCVKYSYDPKSRAVQIGSLGGGKVLTDGSLEIDGEKYSPTYIPPAGTRYQVEQDYITYFGLCGLITGCSTSHHHILLTSGGEFVLTEESLTTVGGSGPGETYVAAGSYPPDQHGNYAIEPRGRIRLAFADGTVQTKTIAVLLDSAGKPDPVNAGFLLDSDYFTFLPDD